VFRSKKSAMTKLAVAAAVMTALVSALPAAAANGELPSVTVKYSDLDPSQPRGATALYERIRAASDHVCASLGHGDALSNMHMQDCVDKVTAQAVANANLPQLTAVHLARRGATRPTRVAELENP